MRVRQGFASAAAFAQERRVVQDIGLVCLTSCVVVGALVGVAFPLFVVFAVVGLLVVWRTALLGCLCAFVVVSSLSAMWWERLDVDLPTSISGQGVVVADPVRNFGTVEMIVAHENRRYLAVVDAAKTAGVGELQTGQQIEISGRVSKLSGKKVAYLRRQHVAGKLVVATLELVGPGNAMYQSANVVRSELARGANQLSAQHAALLLGLTIGDDRNVDDKTREAFRESGIGHLTAVSGANVAFVLLLFAPIIQRFRLTGRFVMSVGVLLMFGLVTRWEPSVIRAEAMALAVLVGALIGRPASLFRALCIGVGAAVAVDPFLVGSIGFLLSASACLGMATIGAGLDGLLSRINDRLGALRRAVSYTVGAQLGVLPMQLAVFGWPSLLSPLVNIVAAPLAAVVLVTGIPAMVLASLTGAPVGAVFLMPAEIGIRCLSWLAHSAAGVS